MIGIDFLYRLVEIKCHIWFLTIGFGNFCFLTLSLSLFHSMCVCVGLGRKRECELGLEGQGVDDSHLFFY